MKYYKIFIKQDYDEMIATRANFIDESQNNNFKQINTGEIIYNSTVFDYFFFGKL